MYPHLGGVGRDLPLALDRQQTALECNLEVVDPDAGELSRDHVGVFALGDVDRRCPGRSTHAWVNSAEQIEPLRWHRVHSQQLVLRITYVFEQFPTCHDCHVILLHASCRTVARRLREEMRLR
jgi:hypothetical protein